MQAIRILVSIQSYCIKFTCIVLIKMEIIRKKITDLPRFYSFFLMFFLLVQNECVCVILRKCHLNFAVILANCPKPGMQCNRIYLVHFFQLISVPINQCMDLGEMCTFIVKLREMVANDSFRFMKKKQPKQQEKKTAANVKKRPKPAN